MKRRLINALVVGLILAPIAIVSLAGSRGRFADQTLPALDTQPSGKTEIIVNAAGFSPAKVKIKAGNIVAWTNLDRSAHSIHPASGPAGFGTLAPIQPSQSYSFRFNQSGDYFYQDPATGYTGEIEVSP